MHKTKAYDEIIDFIAAGTTPGEVIAYKPSETTKKRVANLLHQEKISSLSNEEKAELDHYLQLEHIMRLAKARAHQFVTHDA